MGFLKRMFGGGKKEGSEAGARHTPLRSPAHSAHALALEADDLTGKDLVEKIDQALALAPQDADLLYAKASALSPGFFHAPELGNDAKHAIEQLKKLHADHFYIQMRERNFGFARPSPENWDNLFYSTSWSEKSTSLKGLMSSELRADRHVQIVRHCLTPTVAVVWYADKSICDKVIRMRWELRWARTPHGNIAVHYLVMDCGNNDCLRNEGFLPHGVSNPPHAIDGYSLLQLLAQSDHCFLVLSDDEHRVHRNELFVFPESLKRTLKDVKKQLDKIGPCNPRELSGKAGKWYMDNTDIKSIQF
jgi:hypothetical protein